MREFNTIFVTGGCGFIGSSFIRLVLSKQDFAGIVVNIDSLTYAGNPENLASIVGNSQLTSRYIFSQTDIRDFDAVQRLFEKYRPDAIVHFAAESHVDRSILGPRTFIETNVNGTFNLLEASRALPKVPRFHHVSTDEVFGSLGETGAFTETTPYDPRSPYSASKAASDHLVRAYFHTYGLPVTVSNCSNNYGPYHFPEKLIPLMILNMIDGKPLPVYGDGLQVRDWLYVEDHAEAVWAVLSKGTVGDTYNVGGESEWENVKLVKELCGFVAAEWSSRGVSGPKTATWKSIPTAQELESLIRFVQDRPGHDRRYAIDCSKIKAELGWTQSVNFAQGLKKTIAWYFDNPEWIEQVRSGAYREWINKNYDTRSKG